MRTSVATRIESIPAGVGRYRVGRELAVGGMGAIYEAFDTLAKRPVAYKRLRVSNESARARLTALFEREYNALRQLKHPNIVEVYDYGLDSEGPFYTMELLAGSDLASAAPLPLVEACRIIRDVASALALVHARRLVHRDVTPANVRLTEDGRAKLIDFGALSEFGKAKEIVGTPSFIAPECLSGEPLDARTDLFALGGVAYWALTRRHAYPARSVGDLLDSWEIPVAAPSHYLPELPRELDELVLSLLERDAAARPASAAYVIERLTTLARLPSEEREREVAFSYLLHPPLVGRDAALDALKQYAAQAAAGRGRTVMIEASSGMGRSALLDRIAIDGQLAGANVLRFQPSGKRDGGFAQVLVQWMRAVFPGVWLSQRERNPVLMRETRAPVSALQTPGDVTSQRARLVTAIQGCVEEMSKSAPLTILVDDVQRADAESLAILASLARTIADAPVLLVLTQEERALGSDANALSDLRAIATALPLPALRERDVEALVNAVFGEVANSHRLARFLHAQSGGNAGLTMDLCRLLLESGEIRYALGTFTLPFDPRVDKAAQGTLGLARLTGLGTCALRLIQLLSLHDGSLSAAQAAAALGLSEPEIVTASEDVVSRGLIRFVEGELALASQSLRAAVGAALAADEVATLCAALAHAIIAHGEPSLENKFAACHLLLRAGREDEAIALVWTQLRDTQLPNETIGPIVPVLELLLATLRKRGHSDEQLWPVLWPLVIAGFWGELGAQTRHRDAALAAFTNLTGMTLARRLKSPLGPKLSLVVGMLYGLSRFALTPKRFRAPSFKILMERFFTAVTMSTATAAAAFDPETALRVAAMLDPFAAVEEHKLARVAREFALATAEVIAGQTVRSSERYRRLIQIIETDPRFPKESRETFLDGCMHGVAQAEVSSGAPDALRWADELSHRHAFFRPHVETIKMTFYANRGEKERALEHRQKAEMLALQGGLSWSAFTVLTFRNAYIAMASQDTMGVLQAIAELERLAAIAPSMLVYRDLCQAYLALSRGQAAQALAIYERCAQLPGAKLRPAFELFAALQAEALAQLGRLDEARQLCEESIRARSELGAPRYALRTLLQQLASVEARLGNFARAKELLADVAKDVAFTEAPLQIGSVHREQARVALLERDAAAFDKHFEAMVKAFRATKNPSLIQQCRRLLAEAERSGVVVAPNWERHELAAPANTQDLASQLPEVTELVDVGT